MANDSGQRQTVEIMGEVLPVKTAEDDGRTRKAVERVRDKVNTIKDRSGDANRIQVALLTCLNFAGQLVRIEESPGDLGFSDGTTEKIQELEERIDQLLDGDL